MPRRLTRAYFARPTLEVARDLLGARLVRIDGGRRAGGRIVEVEAYIGEGDSACHASSGRTRRNSVMYGRPGFAYVYFTYGMHWMLNFVTEPEGKPAAVLIRAIEPDEGLESIQARRGGRALHELTSGPARLCKALAIDGALNGEDLVRGGKLLVEAGVEVPDSDVLRTPRIGIDYADPADRKAPWRFVLVTSPHASRGIRRGSRRSGIVRVADARACRP